MRLTAWRTASPSDATILGPTCGCAVLAPPALRAAWPGPPPPCAWYACACPWPNKLPPMPAGWLSSPACRSAVGRTGATPRASAHALHALTGARSGQQSNSLQPARPPLPTSQGAPTAHSGCHASCIQCRLKEVDPPPSWTRGSPGRSAGRPTPQAAAQRPRWGAARCSAGRRGAAQRRGVWWGGRLGAEGH